MKNTNWKVLVIIGVGVLAVILMIVFGVQSSQNKAIALEEQVNTASSDIKVQEKRRVDLVYNLADCVKQYDKHEADTLKAVADGRGSTGDIENVTTAITAVAEAYPELKSNENYKTLMNELSMTENMIAEYRSNYNKQIKEYKRYIRKFPTKQFLELLGYEVQEYEYLDYNAPVDAPQSLFKEDQYMKYGFDFGDFEITKREILASISIIAVMILFGILISSKISEHQMDKNEIYNKAVKIESQEMFQYGMDTNVGNAFVYGDLKAVDTVTYPEIGGEYMYVERVKERYTMHTRQVAHTRTVNGKSQTYYTTDTYWNWDRV